MDEPKAFTDRHLWTPYVTGVSCWACRLSNTLYHAMGGRPALCPGSREALVAWLADAPASVAKAAASAEDGRVPEDAPEAEYRSPRIADDMRAIAEARARLFPQKPATEE